MTFHSQTPARIPKLMGLSALLSITPLAAQLQIDFSRPDGALEPGYQSYEAEHEVNATFSNRAAAGSRDEGRNDFTVINAIEILPDIDTDEDGMPDSYEILNHLVSDCASVSGRQKPAVSLGDGEEIRDRDQGPAVFCQTVEVLGNSGFENGPVG